MHRTLLVVALLALAACKDAGQGTEQAPAPQAQQQAQQQPQAQAPKQEAPAAKPAADLDALRDPASLNETAPASYRARFETTKGPFVIEVTREAAPRGADRFYNLVKNGFYDDVAFFRAIENFMVQFGIHGDPEIAARWRGATFPDDEVKGTNTRGTISFATSGPNSRTTQVFINYKDNTNLDRMGFAPFGRVVEGMEVVDSLYKGYGEGAPRGRGPSQGRIQNEGNEYLRRDFPELDWVKSATIVD